ncbi:MAG: twin-arginine translocase subunit TatC [Eubacteriales bacterium]|nr:twin-arginine translocase subunit TatC [Eubacteriales bacterium]
MNNKSEMSLVGHLNELRKRLTVMVIVNLIVAALLFNRAAVIMQYLLDLNPGMQLVYISPSELLLVYIQISFIMALVLCSPLNIYEVWAFVEKGLYKREKAAVLTALVFGLVCFIGGAVFCYFMVLPTILQFFVRIEIADVASMISVKSYASFANTMLLAFGCVFEMPVLVFLLTKLEILTPEFLKKNQALLIVVIFIFAAIITPPDVVSQIMLGLPMVLLLQLSILISVLVDKKNRKKHEQEAAQ